MESLREQFGCSRFCAGQSTRKPQTSTSLDRAALEASIKSTYFRQISINFNNRLDLLWEQRVGGSNPSAPTITNRLTNETISSAPSGKDGSVSYGLDPVGNRTSATSTIADFAPVSGAFNQDDELASETYDQNGNVTASGGKTFSYDSQNQLVSMNGGAVQIIYDGDGIRVAKTVLTNGVPTITYYLVDDLNPTGYPQVVEELQGGAVTRQYAYGLQRIDENQLISNAWTPSFYGYDGGGNVRQLTNSVGTVTDTYEYDAFGNHWTVDGSTPNNRLYQGEEWDPDLGLYYLRARYINPLTGRFISRDPENSDLTDPTTLHKYLYAGGNPVNLNDPTGRSTYVEVGELNLREAKTALAATAVTAVVLCDLHQDADLLNGIAEGPIWEIRSITFGLCTAKVKRDKCDPGEDNHHMLPQQFRSWFQKCGIPDIDAPEFTQCLPRQCHTGAGGLHSNQNGPGTSWNGRWYNFINNVNGGQCPAGGPQAIVSFMNQLEQEFLQQFLCIGGSS